MFKKRVQLKSFFCEKNDKHEPSPIYTKDSHWLVMAALFNMSPNRLAADVM